MEKKLTFDFDKDFFAALQSEKADEKLDDFEEAVNDFLYGVERLYTGNNAYIYLNPDSKGFVANLETPYVANGEVHIMFDYIGLFRNAVDVFINVGDVLTLRKIERRGGDTVSIEVEKKPAEER